MSGIKLFMPVGLVPKISGDAVMACAARYQAAKSSGKTELISWG
jgi:hypothetical protein